MRAIGVPAAVLQGIEVVKVLETVNMLDGRIVGAQAIALGYAETALWIEANTGTYYGGMRREFAICEPDSV